MQQKTATTQFEVLEIIKKRFSPRAFSDKRITPTDIKTIIEAAQWAPSAVNEQPWRYKVALKENFDSFHQLLDLLTPNNQLWAKEAGALVFCYAKSIYSKNETTNSSAFHDTGMANQNLLLQALSMNIYGRMMGGFDKKRAKEVFLENDDFQPVCIIALGYLGNIEDLSEGLQIKERELRLRKALKEVVEFL